MFKIKFNPNSAFPIQIENETTRFCLTIAEAVHIRNAFNNALTEWENSPQRDMWNKDETPPIMALSVWLLGEQDAPLE